MQCHYALCGDCVIRGSLMQCLLWSQNRVYMSSSSVAKILKAKPDQKDATIIFDVTIDGINHISDGRKLPVKRLDKAVNHG